MRRLLLAACALFIAAAPALAHHGWGSYDAARTMTLKAKLETLRYANPHAEVQVIHRKQRWNVVLAPVTRMTARGLPDGALRIGKQVVIVGYPRTDGTREIRAERIIVDGKTIELR